MTDHEFEILKQKLTVAGSYIRDLQRQFSKETGKQYYFSGPISDEQKAKAAVMVAIDILKEVA